LKRGTANSKYNVDPTVKSPKETKVKDHRSKKNKRSKRKHPCYEVDLQIMKPKDRDNYIKKCQ